MNVVGRSFSPQRAPPNRVGCGGHALCTTAEEDLAVVGLDSLIRVGNGDDARHTVTLYGVRRDVGWNAGHERCDAPDVGGVTLLAYASQDDIVDETGFQASTMDHFLEHDGGEILGSDGSESPAMASNGSTYSTHYDDFLHETPLPGWLSLDMSVAADVLQTKKSKGTLLTGSPCLAVVGHTE